MRTLPILSVTTLGLLFLAACQTPQQNTSINPFVESSTSSVAMTLSSASSMPGTAVTDWSQEPISLSTGNLQVLSYKAEENMVSDLKGLAEFEPDCTTERPNGFFSGIADTYQKIPATVYSIYLNPQSSNDYSNDPYGITILPNTVGYQTLATFKKVFHLCGVGGPYPLLMNKDWLVFSTSCGNSEGCNTVKDVVERTIEIR